MSYSFWGIVEKAKVKSGNDWESRPKSLKETLLTYKPEEICQFNMDYREKLIKSYRWSLWGAAYLINGGCSDDGFDYFRDFLISEGKSIFEAALTNPDSLSEMSEIKDAELELYRYAIYEAYEELTNNDMPTVTMDYPKEPIGDEWDEDELDKLFPKLAEKYS